MNEGELPITKQIELRAYELYLERGCENGHDLVDWLAAEKELTGLSEASASGAPGAQASTAGGLRVRNPRRTVKKVAGAKTALQPRSESVGATSDKAGGVNGSAQH